MIMFECCVCSTAGIRFAIPAGFVLDSDPGLEAENQLCLFAPDDSFRLHYQLTDTDASLEADLKRTIEDCGNHTLVSPTAIVLNGLKCFYAVYGGGGDQYYELRIETPEDTESCLMVLVLTENHDIMDIMESAVFTEILNGISETE